MARRFFGQAGADRRKAAFPAGPCPCGCPVEVKAGNRYASPACAGRVNLRAMPRRVKAEAARARVMAQSHTERVAAARKAGLASREANWERLLDRWLKTWEGGDPRAVLVEAYRTGYGCGYLARRRREVAPLEKAS